MSADRASAHSDEIGGALADQVLDYLVQHPEAQDTVEGIAEWWLLEQRVTHALTEVEAAVAELVAQDLLVARRRSGGRTCYSLNPAHERRIRERRRTRKSM